MALIVEDGTGVTGAESYASAAYADTYFLNRGIAAWAAIADTATKEAYLRQATDYLSQNYAQSWKGNRLTTFQPLDWPRWDVIRDDITPFLTLDPNVIPEELKKATCELALRAIGGQLSPDLTRLTSKETVGPISVEYQPGARPTPRYEAVERLLDPFLRALGGLRIVRG